MSNQEVKLLPERTINIESLKFRIANLAEAILNNCKWEADKELIKDMFYILDPEKLTHKSMQLRYGNYVIDFKLFGYNYITEYNRVNELLDKRDADMVNSFKDIMQFDINIIIEVLKAALYAKRYNVIPAQILIMLTAFELELPIALKYKPKFISWATNKRDGLLEEQSPLLKHKEATQKIIYKGLPTEQRGLFVFSSKLQQEEKRQEYEKRKARLADREAHKLPENTDKDQSNAE